MKCPNCGSENAEGMKFCGECGTKLPEPMNHCPTCNKDWPLTMKFCGECGFKFGGGSITPVGGISLGDKNVIAGDIVNNTTIVNNLKEHETCACCGKSIGPADSFYKCQECGHIVCDRCYDYETKCCLSCGTEKKKKYYKNLQEEILVNPYKYDIEEIEKTEEYFHDSRIQAFLAEWYLQNYMYDKGYEFAQKSASQDNADGIGNLGYCYVCGRGTAKNPEKGMELIEKSISLNSPVGMDRYGDVFYGGKLGAKDKTKALEWYTKAAEKNYIPALYDIGNWYTNEKDYEKAIEYINKAIAYEHPGAISLLGFLYEKGLAGTTDYSKAYELYNRAVNKKWKIAYFSLGEMYKKGIGVTKDIDKAISLFTNSSDCCASLVSLSAIYVQRNQFDMAFKYLEKAAESENPDVVEMLAMFYENGRGVPKNMKLAQEYHQKAKELGYEGK